MRLASQKLGKAVRVKTQTAKHKKSIKHIEDQLAKAEKRLASENTMETDAEPVVESTAPKTKDKSRTDYKRRILNMTSRNGPRATSK